MEKMNVFLSKIIITFLMGMIFFLVLTPISFLMRIFNIDFLDLSFNKKKSYWIEKKRSKNKMKNQF